MKKNGEARMNNGIETISHNKILCAVKGKIISYHAGKLYLQKKYEEKPQVLLNLPIKNWKRFCSKIRLLERLLRLEPRLAIAVSDDEFILSYQGKIYKINVNNKQFVIEHTYRIGMNNTLAFCCENGEILYGEYFGNSNGEEVSIYKRQACGEWKSIYTFPRNTIKHIHNIIYDKYRKCYWILTGDNDDESALWMADTAFSRSVPIFKGKQKYRSCFLIPVNNGIFYTTDTPLENNGLYFSECKDGIWSEPSLEYSISGPCIYGRKLNDNYYVFATSVEPDSSLPTWRYCFTSKLGEGVKDQYSHIYLFKIKTKEIVEVTKFKKDSWKMLLFQFGNAMFPNIDNDDGFVFTGQSVEKYDGKSVKAFYV